MRDIGRNLMVFTMMFAPVRLSARWLADENGEPLDIPMQSGPPAA